MNIVRKLVLLNLQRNITIKAKYIPSKINKIADSITGSQWRKFRTQAPDAKLWPTKFPLQILDV